MTHPITSDWTDTAPVPVSHIADYYDRRWESHKCLAWQLLRRGYRQLSAGRIEACNNLFAVQRSTAPADTARAMHAAEMRGQDMQDADHELSKKLADLYARRLESAHGYSAAISAIVEAYRSKQLITEAECQRRVDAAAAAEREACEDMLNKVAAAVADEAPLSASAFSTAAAAIHARGQK